MRKKGQILIWDMVFGIIIFFISLTITIDIWETQYMEIRNAEDNYEMNWLVESISEQLVRTPGTPSDWTPENVVSFGLVESKPSLKSVQTRILDVDKILYLINSFDDNYTYTRNKMLGTSRYDMYIEISCLNRTDLSCLQGIPLQQVDNKVDCNNKRIGVSDYTTAQYLFYEAEDLWGNHNNLSCDKGCSMGNMSKIYETEDVNITCAPGTYQIWARVFEDGSTTTMRINGDEYPLFNQGVIGLIGWNRVGEVELKPKNLFGFSGTVAGNQMDAMIFTTDNTYDPRYEYHDSFGNPNNESVCIIGNKNTGAEIVSSSKTGVLGLDIGHLELFQGLQTINYNTIRINVVLWGGEELSPRGATSTAPTTTTTLVGYGLQCTGSPIENCVLNFPKVLDILNVTAYNDVGNVDFNLTCGERFNMSVRWVGTHFTDPNYFGFFLNNNSLLLGACESDNTANEDGGEIYSYEMNVSLAPQAVDLMIPDGFYNFYISGDDFGGYCNATDNKADDRFSFDVQVNDCVSYTPLAGTLDTLTTFTPTCMNISDIVEDIYDVSLDSEPLTCGGGTDTVRVKFRSTHDDIDNEIQWSFVLKVGASYRCIGKCNTYVASPTGDPVFYEMTCDLDPSGTDCRNSAYSIPDGNYLFYVVAESFNRWYCTNPTNPLVEASDVTTISVAGC